MADTPAPGAGPPTPTMLFTPAIQTGSEVRCIVLALASAARGG